MEKLEDGMAVVAIGLIALSGFIVGFLLAFGVTS